MNPQFPMFLPTKGRYKTPYTIRMLELLEVPYTAVIEKQEYEQYRKLLPDNKIIVLPHQNEGLTVTRNWIWDYAQSELKTPFFWTIDDNIRNLYRVHKNIKRYVDCGTPFKVIEDFAQRFTNVYISGMNYEMFVPRKVKKPPITMNTRIYSNMLIRTDIPYRNKTFYNDDTDLCLQVLKDGHCTVLFNAFLVDKLPTMKIKGGMTDYYEQTKNRLEFVRELKEAHPDVVELVWKFSRWHHKVDYRPFRRNKPIRDPSVVINKGATNNYDMEMIKTDTPPKSEDIRKMR